MHLASSGSRASGSVLREELERPGMSFPKAVMDKVRRVKRELEKRREGRPVSQTGIFEAGVILFSRQPPAVQLALLEELGVKGRRW